MIITRQMRQLPSRAGGTIMVEMVYCDAPGTPETWDDNAAALAKEYGIDEAEAHVRLMFALPESYGLDRLLK